MRLFCSSASAILGGMKIKPLFFLMLLFLGACSEPTAPAEALSSQNLDPAYGDMLVLASLGDASNLISMLATDSASHEVAAFIYNGLVEYDKEYNIVPDLAESWEILNDGKLIRFHLRQDVKWHDGAPFTADDVMFTYKLIIDPKTPTAYGGKYKLVKEARQIDRYTVEFEYSEPFAPALISWGALEIMPKHLLEGQDITKSELARKPIGTGPFKFKSWDAASRIVLETNLDYFNDRAMINGISYRIIPDQTTQFMELKAGNIDYMGLSPLQYLRQTDNGAFKKAYSKYKYLANGYAYLGFNQKRKPFDDVRFRQAMAYAINKQEIIDGVLLGEGLAATGPYKPGTKWYNPDVRQYEYSVQKAKELLADVGLSDGDGDGMLEYGGQPFEFTIITNQGNDLRSKSATIMQEQLKQVGIKVNIRIIEWTVFLKEFVHKNNFDAIILSWNILQDPDLWTVWHSDNAVPGGLNHTYYINKEVDELLEKGRHTFDEELRKKCYFRVQEILAEEQPYVFLYVPYALPVVSSRFRGIEEAPAGITYNLEEWSVPMAEQKYKVLP